jgi:hypothetical protein
MGQVHDIWRALWWTIIDDCSTPKARARWAKLEQKFNRIRRKTSQKKVKDMCAAMEQTS